MIKFLLALTLISLPFSAQVSANTPCVNCAPSGHNFRCTFIEEGPYLFSCSVNPPAGEYNTKKGLLYYRFKSIETNPAGERQDGKTSAYLNINELNTRQYVVTRVYSGGYIELRGVLCKPGNCDINDSTTFVKGTDPIKLGARCSVERLSE